MLALASVFASCDDTLDIKQPGQVSTGETYTSVANIQKNLYGVYAVVSTYNQIGLNSIWTDEVGIGKDNGGQGIGDGMYGYVMNPSNAYANGLWYNLNRSVNVCNRFIDATQKYLDANEDTISPDDLTTLKHFIAEVRGIRGYAYSEILTYFSSDMKDDSALGAIIFEDIPLIETPNKSRSTVGETYIAIEEDLQYVIDNYDADVASSRGSANRSLYITPEFVTALRARINLYRGNYSEALAYANDIIAVYPTVSRANYAKTFDDTSNTDIIFKLARKTNNDTKAGDLFASINATVTGSPFYEVGRSLYNLYTDGDIRKNVVTNPTAIAVADYVNTFDYINDDILPVGKYTRANNVNLLGDLKVLRVSEVYLIAAEAEIMLGLTNDAQSKINYIRANRILPISNVTLTGVQQTDLRTLLRERRMELAFEGFRWVDLKRLSTLADVYFDRDQMDCRYNLSCGNAPAPGSYLYTLPIPSTEINVNTQIIQNQGY